MIVTNTMIVLMAIGFLVLMFFKYRKISLPVHVDRCTEDMTEEEVIFNTFQQGVVARRKFRFCIKSLLGITAILIVLLISNGIHGQLFVSKSGYNYQPTFFWLSLIGIGLMVYIGTLLGALFGIKDSLNNIDGDTGKAYDVIDKRIKEYEEQIEEYENKYK